ncbi:MAG: molybdenum cofactor guanylyltransferase [Chloroflexota bacterium]|jgi:molybdopterin-guanine dinucleotide biosynthesis protein A|nr:molybdenum cofactor guanylyltransferase [Chloroflexota bacterium]MEA2667091.1 molybdenum cofactor guanylyltransferase [Chloroflexota bacterium]
MRSGCSLVILAGGLSRRMGQDKATLPAGDGTLIEHLARRLGPVVDETIIAGGSVYPSFEGARVVADYQPGLGPLAGMLAGFAAATRRHVWVVGCDLPDVEPALGGLLRTLAGDYEAVVPRPDQEPEGVCALYVRELGPRIAMLLESGERSVKSLLDRSSVRYLASDELRAVDPELRSFRNINTPSDYEDWLRTQPVSR